MQNPFGALRLDSKGRDAMLMPFRIGSLATKLFLAIVAAVLAGSAAAMWAAEPAAEFGRVFLPPPAVAPGDAANEIARSEGLLPDRLRSIAQAAGIRADQQAAWTRFAGVVSMLDGLTREHDRRRAAGAAIDDEAERANHTLLLGGALADLYESLSPGQAATVRRLTDDLTRTVVCRGILAS